MTTPPAMIPVFRPLIEDEELHASRESLERGWLGMGSYVGEFEQRLRTFLEAGDRHVIAVSTGHAALHLALLSMGVGPGDEVITPSFNNAADFQAILATGAEPVFCDIAEDSLCIDIEKAKALVSPCTKAAIVMDYDCALCDHDQVAEFSRQSGIRILHDAAHSFGSRYKGKKVGSFSDVAIFSFDPVKTITCIDGGAIVVRGDADVEKLHALRLLGMTQPATVMYQDSRAWTYDITSVGFRYHMANLHAAIGLAQLAKIDRISESRRRACHHYNDRLRDVAGIVTPRGDLTDITPFLYYVRVPAERRDRFRRFLSDRGIDTGIHWQPGHWFTHLRHYRRGELAVTERIGREIVSLPLHSDMPEATLARVTDAIREFFSG